MLVKIERSFPHSEDLANAYLNFAIRVLELASSSPGNASNTLPKSRAELTVAVKKAVQRKNSSTKPEIGKATLYSARVY